MAEYFFDLSKNVASLALMECHAVHTGHVFSTQKNKPELRVALAQVVVPTPSICWRYFDLLDALLLDVK